MARSATGARSAAPRLRSIASTPAWIVFAVLFAGVVATHFSLLRLPYYWDEAGYYIPAAWDFFRTGSLIPSSTLSNAHPPVPSVVLAACWKLFGFTPVVTRIAVAAVASVALAAVWRLALRLTGSVAVAAWTTALTALYPIWFAQSTLAHADIFAAACTMWAMVYALPAEGRRPRLAAVWFTAAVLSKETALAVPFTLAFAALIESFGAERPLRRALWREALWLTACAGPLAAWYAFNYCKTGYAFGNPEFVRYNAQSTMDLVRILDAFGHRLLHLTAHMNLFVPVLMALAALLLAARSGRAAIDRGTCWRIFGLLVTEALAFSVLGGALLTRYLLPMYPLVLLLAISTLWRRAPFWHAFAAISAVAFVAGLFLNPPYGFAPEDNLAYARVVRMHQAGIAQLAGRYPGATVLSAWPLSDEISRPELGYVQEPFDVYRLEDFTSGQIDRAAGEPERYSAALVFSTKYDPPPPNIPFLRSQGAEERYFGLHHDRKPDAIAAQLHGEMVWRQDQGGMWIALIRFNRQFEARMVEPAQRAGR